MKNKKYFKKIDYPNSLIINLIISITLILILIINCGKRKLPDLPEMIRIPGGYFEMGKTDEASGRLVYINDFEISKFEVTNKQFLKFTEATSYFTEIEKKPSAWELRSGLQNGWRTFSKAGYENNPVILISWKDAESYCKWLSQVTNEKYRLPTEAEWEYAARGGLIGKKYPWGDNIESGIANYGNLINKPASVKKVLEYLKPVGSYKPNGYGLYDMAGNIDELCIDWYDEDYYMNGPFKNPQGPKNYTNPSGVFSGPYHVIRGGAWNSSEYSCRVVSRGFSNGYNFMVGFRVVKVIESNDKLKLTGRILFKSYKENISNIYCMNSDGTNVVELTNIGAELSSCSPDGMSIVFDSKQQGTWGLYILDVNSKEYRKLISEMDADYVCPAWSPDGQWVAFSGKQGGLFGPRYGQNFNPNPWNIYLIDLSRMETKKLTNGRRFEGNVNPSWSPDGKYIAFTSNRDGNEEIYIMNYDGSEQYNLTKNAANDRFPAWSPEGNMIAFTSTRDGNSEIYISDLKGNNLKKLTNNAAEDLYPTWSPDGKYIAFWTERDGNGEIYKLKIDSGNDRINLTRSNSNEGSPYWCR